MQVLNNNPRLPWTAVEEGLVFSRPTGDMPSAKALTALMVQLEDEGLAELTDSGWALPWSAIYSLFRLRAYADALPLLELPPLLAAGPVLRSHGSLTDAAFLISINGVED